MESLPEVVRGASQGSGRLLGSPGSDCALQWLRLACGVRLVSSRMIFLGPGGCWRGKGEEERTLDQEEGVF